LILLLFFIFILSLRIGSNSLSFGSVNNPNSTNRLPSNTLGNLGLNPSLNNVQSNYKPNSLSNSSSNPSPFASISNHSQKLPSSSPFTSFGGHANMPLHGNQMHYLRTTASENDSFTIENEDFPALPGSTNPVLPRNDGSGGTISSVVGSATTFHSTSYSQNPESNMNGSSIASTGLLGGFSAENSGSMSAVNHARTGASIGESALSQQLTNDLATGSTNSNSQHNSSNNNSITGGGASMSKEAKFGMSGLMDILQITDKVKRNKEKQREAKWNE
jgi:hypothetical protein